MLKVGLTGGVACGKSLVGRMFVARGAQLIEADKVAHQLMQPGQAIYQELVKRFGPEIVNPDRSINRQKLADVAFDQGGVGELNRIVHPAVIAYQDRWMEQAGARQKGAIVIVEAALILEAGAASRFDKLVVVTCRPEQKVERYAARHDRQLEEARHEVERRSAAQWPDERKVAAADYVIDNSGAEADTEGQVDRIYEELKRLAERGK